MNVKFHSGVICIPLIPLVCDIDNEPLVPFFLFTFAGILIWLNHSNHLRGEEELIFLHNSPIIYKLVPCSAFSRKMVGN